MKRSAAIKRSAAVLAAIACMLLALLGCSSGVMTDDGAGGDAVEEAEDAGGSPDAPDGDEEDGDSEDAGD